MQAEIDSIFDRVYVVSLPDAAERRAHIRAHFSDIGLRQYEFFDALPGASAEVKEAIRSGMVFRYPPCFRCGKKNCGKSDCNNVLIPPQIGNFLTQLRLWRRISQSPQRALVIEDDVAFQPDAAATLHCLHGAIEAGEIAFEPETPKLLRLGWALGEDHREGAAFELRAEPRMSNPCYGVTSAYAKALLARFQKIDTTSDIYLHARAPRTGEAVTVLPPLASELSWSVGAVASQIHPKPIRTEYLKARGSEDAAQENERAIRSHLAHMVHRPLLLIGYPGAGAELAATLLADRGLNFKPNDAAADAANCWTFAVDADAPFARSFAAPRRAGLVWDFLIQPLCSLESAIPAIMEAEKTRTPERNFRRRHILKAFDIDLYACASQLDQALLSYTLWHDLIARLKPDLSFRLEDEVGKLREFLKGKGFPLHTLGKSGASAETHIPTNTIDWAGAHELAKQHALGFCARFGYAPPTGLR